MIERVREGCASQQAACTQRANLKWSQMLAAACYEDCYVNTLLFRAHQAVPGSDHCGARID